MQQNLAHEATHSAIRGALTPARPTGETVVIGLGSAHGDDQIGWLVADEVARVLGSAITVCNLTSPIDLACCLEGCRNAVIIDAIRSNHLSVPAQRWEWPTPEIALLRGSGTHAIGLPETLELAAQLDRLPDSVVIWGIVGRCFSPGADVSPALQSLVPQLASQIIERDLLAAQSGG